MVPPIELHRLAWAFLPVAVLLIWLFGSGRDPRPSLHALARMTLQLLLVGYVLVSLFDPPYWWLPTVALSVMLLAAAAISIRTSNQRRMKRFGLAAGSIAIAGGGTLGLMLIAVLGVLPWEQPRVVIPLAGMTFSSCMNAIAIAVERFDATASDSTHSAARERALAAALIPITNSLLAVGLVSIPGLMTGQVLAGVAPLIAARYQIMIMCLVYASSGLSVLGFLWLDSLVAGDVDD